MGERFPVSREFGGKPAFGTEFFGEGVESGIAAQSPFEGDTDGSSGDVITFIYIVLGEDMWDAWF